MDPNEFKKICVDAEAANLNDWIYNAECNKRI